MEDRLSRIYITEEVKTNCPFYSKIGACRHGDHCSRLHNKPLRSQTILMPHMYHPAVYEGIRIPEKDIKEAVSPFEEFYEDVWLELWSYGELLELHVCDNICDHLVGNVYAKFKNEDEAEAAAKKLNGRYYDGRIISAEFSPVIDFKGAICIQHEEGCCNRGVYCNFIHLKQIPRAFRKPLEHL